MPFERKIGGCWTVCCSCSWTFGKGQQELKTLQRKRCVCQKRQEKGEGQGGKDLETYKARVKRPEEKEEEEKRREEGEEEIRQALQKEEKMKI